MYRVRMVLTPLVSKFSGRKSGARSCSAESNRRQGAGEPEHSFARAQYFVVLTLILRIMYIVRGLEPSQIPCAFQYLLHGLVFAKRGKAIR
jgi:hypothetical protein